MNLEHSEIKPAITYEKNAVYKGGVYKVNGIRGYKIPNRRDIGYSIELLDKSRNSLLYAPLDEVELEENEDGR